MKLRYLSFGSQLADWIHPAMTHWGTVLEWASGEFLLTRLRRGNGGDVIVLRSLITSGVIYVAIMLLPTAKDPDITWFGTFFALAYAALYARFSQQWHYMANLYNSIKTSEVRTAKDADPGDVLADRLAQWKAGYIEDADTLHLAMKPAVSSVICIWGNDERVKRWFESYTTGGRARLERILTGAQETCKREETRWRVA